MHGRCGSTANAGKASAIALHLPVRLQPGAYIIEKTGRVRVGWLDDPVMHPFPVASRRDDPGTTQVAQVAGYLRLAGAEHGNEEAYANLIIPDEVE